MYNVILVCVRVTIVAVEEKKIIVYSECVFAAVVIQDVKCMCVLYCYLWLVWLYHITFHSTS
jgi:hypothetical protein